MTMRQPRTGNLLAMRAETGEKFDKFPAGVSRFNTKSSNCKRN